MSETNSTPASTGNGYQSLALAGAGVVLAASVLSARPAKAQTTTFTVQRHSRHGKHQGAELRPCA